MEPRQRPCRDRCCCFQAGKQDGHELIAKLEGYQRLALFIPNPNQQQRPRRTQPAAGCKTFEQLRQREQERGYKPGWARHVWAARQRSA